MRRICSAAFVALAATVVQAQVPSRAGEILAERVAKARDLKPEQPNKVERTFLRFRDGKWLERFTEGMLGFRPRFGGMVPGAGFAIGPEYQWQDRDEPTIVFRTGGQISTRAYRKYDLLLGLPRLANGVAFAEFYAVHHDYPSLGYYGSGPESEKSGRSNYRFEDTAVDATVGVRPLRRLSLGSSLGYVINNIGPGEDSRFISADRIYSSAQAPGIGRQPNLLRYGAFAQYDYRDLPEGARRGGNYFAQFSDYRDQTLNLHDFQRLDIELQQFLPLFNERRVFAIRARSSMCFHRNDQTIPFWHQPALGGSDDLRGFRPLRFRGNNSVVFNPEYRWEVFSGLDMALFADAGQVSDRISDFNLGRLQADAGFGFRFNAYNRTFLRLDVGFSHEGFQVAVKFNNLFRQGPLHSSSSQREY